MPELPEVERAAAQMRSLGIGKKITRVQTTEDTIVYSGTSHEDFAQELTGRTIKGAKRYGKVFYLDLDGEGKMPVLHFGMTGMLQVKGELANYYRKTPSQASTDWPPRFMKFILHLLDEPSGSVTEVAFLDARRLGRIRLCASPLTEPPISAMGFDPLLSMPPLEQFKQSVLKRGCPIKALLLDQSFSAGVGNWVADEILYHSRVHPEQRCKTLTDEQLEVLYNQIVTVCRIGVENNADDTKYPDNWLFKHRWSKGKKAKHSLLLPSGEPATIKWLTVGGRTSAFVVELQRLPKSAAQTPRNEGDEGDLTSLSESESEVKSAPKKRKSSKGQAKLADSGPSSMGTPSKKAKKKT